MTEKLSGGIFCFGIYHSENYSLSWLSIQYDRTLGSCYHQRDHGEILFSIDKDCERGMIDCMLKRADQIIGQRAGGIFYPDVFTMDFRHLSAWRPHGISINNRDIGDNSLFPEAVGNNVTDSIYNVA